MTCGQCRGIERIFDEKEAKRDLKGYRKKGPSKTTQMLIDIIEAEGIADKTLLDIGGGVGAIQHELLKAGAGGAVSVDASKAYIGAAKEEARRQGHADRIQQRDGDFVDIAPEIEPADVVTLDKVICCYHDVERLVSLSSQRATRLYGLVYPRDSWMARTGFRLFNVFFWLRRHPFRVFVHPTATVDALVRRSGFQRSFHRKTFIWQVVVYTR